MRRSSGASSAPEGGAPPPLALLGPTASGKTAVGILLAERLGTEVIGCDSRQVYRGLAVGTAQPTAAELSRVRHHLVAVVEPAERYSAARYRDAVQALLPRFAARRRPALFVGGTGLYLRAALQGLSPAPPGNPRLRRWLAELGRTLPGGLHQLLERVDPVAAARIHPRDGYRLARALEVFQISGRPISEHHGLHRAAAPARTARLFAIELPAADLRARIARRLEAMMDAGFLDEARGLLASGVDPALPALRAVGYPELFAHLRGETTLEAALAAARRATWQYARRQFTWFRAEPGVTWIPARGDSPAEELADVILRHLNRGEGAA